MAPPMLIDSYELNARCSPWSFRTDSSVDVDELGVVAVAVIPGPLQKPVGFDRTFRGIDDFAGSGDSRRQLAARCRHPHGVGRHARSRPASARLAARGRQVHRSQRICLQRRGNVGPSSDGRDRGGDRQPQSVRCPLHRHRQPRHLRLARRRASRRRCATPGLHRSTTSSNRPCPDRPRRCSRSATPASSSSRRPTESWRLCEPP